VVHRGESWHITGPAVIYGMIEDGYGDHLMLGMDAARQGYALHLAAGQRHHRAVGIFRQADQRQRFVNLRSGLRP